MLCAVTCDHRVLTQHEAISFVLDSEHVMDIGVVGNAHSRPKMFHLSQISADKNGKVGAVSTLVHDQSAMS